MRPDAAFSTALALLRAEEFDAAQLYRLIGRMPPEQSLVVMAMIPDDHLHAFAKQGARDGDADYGLGLGFSLMYSLRGHLSPEELTQVIGVVARDLRRTPSTTYPARPGPVLDAQMPLDVSTVQKTAKALAARDYRPFESLARGSTALLLAMADDCPDARRVAERAVERIQESFLENSRSTTVSLWIHGLGDIALFSGVAAVIVSFIGLFVGEAMAATPAISYLTMWIVQNGRIAQIRERTHWFLLPATLARRMALSSVGAVALPMTAVALLLTGADLAFALSVSGSPLFVLAAEPAKLRRLVPTRIDMTDFFPDPEEIGAPPYPVRY